MSASKLLKTFVRREILARQDIVGTVVSQREIREYNTGGSPVWVCDVDVGGNRTLSNVPIKAIGNGTRFYAERGQTVLLRRNTQGRYDVVGPSDRIVAVANLKTYNLGNNTPVQDTQAGFQFVPKPFEFYKGDTPGTPGTSRWNDGVTPFPFVEIQDAQGNPV